MFSGIWNKLFYWQITILSETQKNYHKIFSNNERNFSLNENKLSTINNFLQIDRITTDETTEKKLHKSTKTGQQTCGSNNREKKLFYFFSSYTYIVVLIVFDLQTPRTNSVRCMCDVLVHTIFHSLFISLLPCRKSTKSKNENVCITNTYIHTGWTHRQIHTHVFKEREREKNGKCNKCKYYGWSYILVRSQRDTHLHDALWMCELRCTQRRSTQPIFTHSKCKTGSQVLSTESNAKESSQYTRAIQHKEHIHCNMEIAPLCRFCFAFYFPRKKFDYINKLHRKYANELSPPPPPSSIRRQYLVQTSKIITTDLFFDSLFSFSFSLCYSCQLDEMKYKQEQQQQ